MRGWAPREASDDCVPAIKVWAWNGGEEQVGIVDVTRWRGAESEDAASSNGVVSKAGFDDVGMDLLEVFHVGALGLEHGEAWLVGDELCYGGWGEDP